MNEIRITGIIIPNEFGSTYRILEIDHVTPATVSAALANAQEGADILLDIDSPGGICDAGFQIINIIRDYQQRTACKVNVRLGAVVASMASVIAFSFPDGKVTARPNTRLMIHGCSAIADGKVQDIEAEAANMRLINDEIVRTLAARTGKDRATYQAWIDQVADKWLSPSALKAEGLIDDIEPTPARAADPAILTKAAQASKAIAAIAAACSASPAAAKSIAASIAAVATVITATEPAAPAKPASAATPATASHPSDEADTLRAQVKSLTDKLTDSEENLAAARADLDATRQQLTDAQARLTHAASVANALTGKPTTPSIDAKAAWRQAVDECASASEAIFRHPDLYIAARNSGH